MEINKVHFPELIPDNEQLFFDMLIGAIESVDELCALQITKKVNCYHFRIAPSAPKYNQHILREILYFHNLFDIKLDLSKSIKTSGSIDYELSL